MKIPVVVYYTDKKSEFYFTNPFELGYNVLGHYRTHEGDTLEELQTNGIYELIGFKNPKYKLDMAKLGEQQAKQIREETKDLINVTWHEIRG